MESTLSFQLSNLDWAVFIAVLVITFLATVYGQKIKKSGGNSMLDHLVMGRQLTAPLFIATLVATWYGGILGVTENAFKNGIHNWITQGIFWYVAYLIFAFFIVHKVSSYQAVTLPDLIEKM